MFIIFLTTLLLTLQVLIYLHRKREKERAEDKEQKELRGQANEVVLQKMASRMQRLSSFNIVHAGEDSTPLDFLTLKPDKTKIGFEFESLSLVLNSGQHIIEHVTGQVVAGKMTAIMGPSGCGKTTMLNVLRNKVRACASPNDERKRRLGINRLAALILLFLKHSLLTPTSFLI